MRACVAHAQEGVERWARRAETTEEEVEALCEPEEVVGQEVNGAVGIPRLCVVRGVVSGTIGLSCA